MEELGISFRSGLGEPIAEPPIYRRRVKFFTNNRWFDISRARTELGFAPRTPLKEGLRRTLDSYRSLGWV